MRYQIVKDIPGYLRIRFGRCAFTDVQGYGIAEEIRRAAGVADVTTTPANGGVLVRYDVKLASCRTRILGVLDSLDRLDLPISKGSEEQLAYEAGNNLKTGIFTRAGGFALRRLFLPPILRNAWTAVRSLGYISEGLKHLVGKRELSVEVLDATAISAAMLTGMFGSAGEIMLLLDISSMLEEYTHARSRLALSQSLAFDVDKVCLVSGEGDVLVPLDDVREGDMIRVRTGSMVPVDGMVVDGEAAVNESSMTGESKLAIKAIGSSVFAGTVVDDGNIVVKVRNVGSDTRIQNILRMVDESNKAKASIQSKAERLADAIVPFNLLAFIGILAVTRNMVRAMSVLLVDYSCAIKLSTPIAIMSGMREAADRGMVVKGGKFFEMIAAADTIVFDKTGTLTMASPQVVRVIAVDSRYSEDEILRISACLEEHFPHSMARAVVAAAEERGILHDEEAHADVKYIVAHGIASSLGASAVLLGSAHYIFEDEGVTLPEGYLQMLDEIASGCSVIHLAIDRRPVGAICIADPLREEAEKAVDKLRELGIGRIVMLTGDSEGAAKAAAGQLGISEWRSQVLPEEKALIIAELKEQGGTVLMVGDGVNDSPALAEADCSLAMVDASDIAREVADVTLLNSSLDELVTLRKLSSRLVKRVADNYKAIVVFNTGLLVAGVLGLLQPTVSAVLHNSSTALIAASSMRPLMSDFER